MIYRSQGRKKSKNKYENTTYCSYICCLVTIYRVLTNINVMINLSYIYRMIATYMYEYTYIHFVFPFATF